MRVLRTGFEMPWPIIQPAADADGRDLLGQGPKITIRVAHAVNRRTSSALLAWNPTAVIVTGFDHTDTARRMPEDSRIRVAELMDIDDKPIDLAVGLSHRRAGRATAEHLVRGGYRRIGYVGHDWTADRRAWARMTASATLCPTLASSSLSRPRADAVTRGHADHPDDRCSQSGS